MQAVVEQSSASPRVIVFPAPMGKPKPKPAPQQRPDASQGFHPPTHGNYAQWAAVFAALVFGVVNLGLTVYFHQAESASKSSDEHLNSLIDAKLSPITQKLNELSEKISDAQGQLKRLQGTAPGQKQVLTSIRTEIGAAESQRTVLSPTQLAEYKNSIRSIPRSVPDYWTTVAAIINYQSSIDQLNGHAPDPAAVSRPCGSGITDPTGGTQSFNNTFEDMVMSNCIVDLDKNIFIRVTFRNSVVRYHGNLTTLANVHFVNCRFVLNIPASSPANPERERFLMTLLDAPDTRTVSVASTHS